MSQAEEQERPKSIQLQKQNEGETHPQQHPELAMKDIMQQVDPQQNQPQQASIRASQITPPVIKNPIYYYNGHTKYNWRLSELEPTAILERLQSQPIPFSDELPFANDVHLSLKQIHVEIKDTHVTTSGMNKHVGYVAHRRDKNGEGTFTRRYTQYTILRKKLAELWPGVFIPHLPNKTLIGSSQEQVLRSRTKYILHFWRQLSFYDRIYYSEEVAHFFDDNVNIEATLERIQTQKVGELLEKYKNAFPEAYQKCHSQEFMYKKDQAPIIFQEFQAYFGKKKIDLVEFKDSFMRLGELKTKYIKAVSKLNQTLLPSYENIIFRWFNGVPIEDKEPSLMQRMNRKSIESRKSSESAPKTEVEKQQPQPQPVVLQPLPNSKPLQFPNPLYNSQAYKSKLQDTAHQIQDYNSSVWVLYDVLKFQLKDIDTVLQALEQVRYMQKEIEYLRRSISVNKEQIQSINNRKTTLKTFFMGGTEDDKKNRLSNENQAFQQKLQKTVEFYHILLALVQQQLMRYHHERVEYYTRAVRKSISDELGIARSVMDFHIYEYQLFAKQRQRKIQELYPPHNQHVEEEIKE